MRRQSLISLFIMFFGSFLGQKSQINHFNSTNDLKSQYIYDIAQDEKGYLWLATGDGLIRVDNNKNKIAHGPSNSEPHFVIKQLTVGKKGVYYSDKNGLIYKYHNNRHDLIENDFNQSIKQQIFWKNKILFLSNEKQIFAWDENNSTGKAHELEASNSDLIVPFENQLLLFGNQKVTVLNNNYKVVAERPFNFTISCFEKISTNEWLLGTEEGELLLFSSLTLKVEKITLNGTKTISSPIKSIKKNSPYSYWIGTFGEGIFELVQKENKSFLLKSDFDNTPDIAYCNKIFVDYENNCWIGTYGKGLFQIKPNYLFYVPYKNETLSIQAQSIYGKNIYYCTENKIFYVDENQINHLVTQFPSISKISALEVLNQQYIFISSESEGLYKIETKSGKRFKINLPERAHGSINAITLENDNIWVGTVDGLYKIDKDGKLLNEFNTSNGLRHNMVNAIKYSENFGLIIGTKSNQLALLKDNVITELKLPSENQLLNISSIKIFGKNAIITTQGNGFFKIENGKIKSYNTNSGLINNFISSVEILDDEYIILFSESDVFLYSLKTNTNMKIFNHDEVLNAYKVHCNSNVDGENIYIGTEKGLFRFQKKLFFFQFNRPKTIYEKVSLGINTIYEDDFKSEYTLEANDNFLRIYFKSLCFLDPDLIEYQYRMKGMDYEWHVAEESSVSYKNLPPGKYEFEIKTCLKGNCEEKSLPIVFYVKQPFWLVARNQIIAFFLLFIGTLIFLGIKMRRIERKRKLLQYSLKEKNIELKQKMNDINLGEDYVNIIQKITQPKFNDFKPVNFDTFMIKRNNATIEKEFFWHNTIEDRSIFSLATHEHAGINKGLLSIWLQKTLELAVEKHRVSNPNLIKMFLKTSLEEQVSNQDQISIKLLIGQIDQTSQELIFSNVGQTMILIYQNGMSKNFTNNEIFNNKFSESSSENIRIELQKINSFYLISNDFLKYKTLTINDLTNFLKDDPLENFQKEKERIHNFLNSKIPSDFLNESFTMIGFRVIR